MAAKLVDEEPALVRLEPKPIDVGAVVVPIVGAVVVLAAGVDEKLNEKEGFTPVVAAAPAVVAPVVDEPNNDLALGSLVEAVDDELRPPNVNPVELLLLLFEFALLLLLLKLNIFLGFLLFDINCY